MSRKNRAADVAQLAEHLICNQAVASSSLAVSSVVTVSRRRGADAVCALELVGYPSGQREQTVNLPAYAFEGSNPSPTMRCGSSRSLGGAARRGVAGVAQLVERQPSKLNVAGSSPVSRLDASVAAA